MNIFIGLLRGINVGGKNILPMRELVKILEGMGLSQVKTYIQSGNIVFQTETSDISQLSKEISAAIGESHGFSPAVMVLTHQAFQQALAANPFPEAEQEPKTLHLYFLDGLPKDPDFEALDKIKADSERYQLIDTVLYLHAPDGIGRSKLAAKIGKGWDVAVTARNWRTVGKIASLALELTI